MIPGLLNQALAFSSAPVPAHPRHQGLRLPAGIGAGPADPPPTLPASAASGRGELTSAARKCRRFDAGVAAFAAIS